MALYVLHTSIISAISSLCDLVTLTLELLISELIQRRNMGNFCQFLVFGLFVLNLAASTEQKGMKGQTVRLGYEVQS